jgi:hypothetical protein
LKVAKRSSIETAHTILLCAGNIYSLRLKRP